MAKRTTIFKANPKLGGRTWISKASTIRFRASMPRKVQRCADSMQLLETNNKPLHILIVSHQDSGTSGYRALPIRQAQPSI